MGPELVCRVTPRFIPPHMRTLRHCRLQYHAALGVSRLYLLYDGADAAVERALSALPRVEVLMAAGPLAAPEEAADFAAYRARADNHGGWLGRPGDYDKMVKQGGRPWLAQGAAQGADRPQLRCSPACLGAPAQACCLPAVYNQTVIHVRLPTALAQPMGSRARSTWRARTAPTGSSRSTQMSC